MEIIQVCNAGLSLLSPWLHRLFKMLDYLNEDGKQFKNTESQIRAIFVLQRTLGYDDYRTYNEHELIFNRLLTGCPSSVPLPESLELTTKEEECVYSMLNGVKNNWDKLKNTSIRGFQESFLRRPGQLTHNDEKWLVNVDPVSYDIMLDSLPWNYKLIRYPWFKEPINVEWR